MFKFCTPLFSPKRLLWPLCCLQGWTGLGSIIQYILSFRILALQNLKLLLRSSNREYAKTLFHPQKRSFNYTIYYEKNTGHLTLWTQLVHSILLASVTLWDNHPRIPIYPNLIFLYITQLTLHDQLFRFNLT